MKMFANNSNYNVRPILYYDDINPHSRAVLMILNMLDVDIELRAVEMIKGEHLKPAYAQINPAHTVPTMVHKDLVITGNAIFSYVCENNDNEKANQLIALKCYKRHCCVLSRLFFESQVLHRIHGHLMTDLVRKTIFQTDVDYHQRKVEHAYDVMEAYLNDGQFMAGPVLTAADISFVACLGALDMMFPLNGDRERWEKLNDWYRRMRSLSIQKINEFGIEKQRQIVEYFAKFQFKSDIKRFTIGLRESLIPSLPTRLDRCSVSIQTVNGPEIASATEKRTVDILSEKHNIGKITYLEDQRALKVTGDRNAPVISTAVQDVVAPKIVNEINKIAKTKINEILNEELEKELARFSKPEFPPPPINEEPNPFERTIPILNDTEKSVAFSETTNDEKFIWIERSLGGAHKEKPPVPPKRKRYLPPKEENSGELANTATNSQKPDEAEASEDTMKVFENNALCPVSEKEESIFYECVHTTSASNRNSAPSQAHKLSRLNGGVESTLLLEKIDENQIRLQPPAAFPLISASSNSRENNKVSQNTSETITIGKIKTDPNSMKASIGNLPKSSSLISASNSRETNMVSQKTTKTTIALNSTKQKSQTKNLDDAKIKLTETLLPEGLPINGQQIALIYTRGATAPNLLLPVPPPSPELYSQDEDFPPPPSELLIPKKDPRPKTTPTTRLPNVKPAVGPNQRFGKKKSSCIRPISDIAVEGKAKVVCKKSCDLKLLTGRKSPAQDSKVYKLAQKLNNGGLFARSPCSNRSQGSIVRCRCRKVPNTKVSSQTKRLDKKINKLKSDSGGTIVENSDSSTNIIQRLIGHTSKFSATEQLTAKSTENQERVEGGKQETLSSAAEGYNSTLQQPSIFAMKSKTIMKTEDENKNGERCQQNPSKLSKTRPKTPSNSTTEEMKPVSQNFVSRNKQKPYPTQTRFQTKNLKIASNSQPTKYFDTSPYKPGQSFNNQQFKAVAEKRPTTKNKRNRGTKAHSDDVSNKTQAPLTQALPTSTSVLDKSAIQQSEPEQITPPTAVGTVSSTLKTLTETIHISPKLTSPLTSESDDTIIADVPVKVGLVATALETLNAASSNFRPYSTCNINKELTQATSPFPPPAPTNHRHIAITPSPLPVKDVLPQAGTVAKALQSLSAVTSEGNPLCGAVKAFRKADLKYMDTARSPVVADKGLNNAVPFNVDEKIAAIPLAEVLTATVKQVNRESFDDTKSTTLSEGIKEMLLKMQTLPDEVMTPVVIVNSTTINTQPFQSTFITPSTSVITGLKHSTDKIILDSESNNPLLTAQHTSNMEDSPEALVPPTICEPDQVLVSPKKISISEPYNMAKSYPSWAACTDATILSASEVKSSKEEKNKLEASKSKRYVIDRTMINDGILDMELTPLPGQPNIIITGYTPVEPKNVGPLFIGTGRPHGNIIAPTLRRPTKDPCSHGPSANVVISTFGYTPMSDSGNIPQHLMHLINKPIFNEQQTAPPPPGLSTAAGQVTAICEDRSLCPRLKGDRPYPTAHRSGSQRKVRQSIKISGRVM